MLRYRCAPFFACRVYKFATLFYMLRYSCGCAPFFACRVYKFAS
jgi:hypothetical protein